MALGAGLLAIALWAALASLTVASAAVPPFLLLAVSFAIACLIGLAIAAARGRITRLNDEPMGAVVLAFAGLFGYHALYVFALRLAPPLEANLLNYLWPLLIVVFAASLPAWLQGRPPLRLGWWHGVGVAMGLAGAVIVVIAGARPGLENQAARLAPLGFALALAAAVTWAGYSVLGRRYPTAGLGTVTLACGLTAISATCLHRLLEVAPALDRAQALALLAMGLGPMGGAFYLWDHACKHGDLRVLGAAAYATPVLSTALLVALGFGEGQPALWLGCLLTTVGACLAARDVWRDLIARLTKKPR